MVKQVLLASPLLAEAFGAPSNDSLDTLRLVMPASYSTLLLFCCEATRHAPLCRLISARRDLERDELRIF